jgi:hypothetical protein
VLDKAKEGRAKNGIDGGVREGHGAPMGKERFTELQTPLHNTDNSGIWMSNRGKQTECQGESRLNNLFVRYWPYTVSILVDVFNTISGVVTYPAKHKVFRCGRDLCEARK